MRRPVGVSLAAVFLSAVAVLGFLLTIVLVQIVSRANIRNHQSTYLIIAVLILVFAAITLFTICILGGLLRGKNWARLAGIMLGAVLAIFAALLLFITTASLVMPQLQHQATLGPGLLIAELSYLAIAVLGIWLAVYLNTESVKRTFRADETYVPDTSAYPTQSGQGFSLARVVVLTLCVIGTITCIYLLSHAFSNKPYFYLGISMNGKAANAFRVCCGAVVIVLNLGVFLRSVPAYYAMLVVQISNATSFLLLLLPAYRVHATRLLMNASGRNSAASVHPLVLASMVLSGLVSVIFIWVLWLDLADTRSRSKQPQIVLE